MTVVIGRSDADARRLIREAIDQTLVVEAAAGTGKTTELVNRIVRVLAEGRADVREIVAVTFTEKAAGELKLRLRQELERQRQETDDPTVAARLEDAVQNLEEAHVSTIHGFCADLLRERPVEARVDPVFRVLTEGQAERLFNEAFTAWFQEHLEDPPEGVRRSLRRASRGSRFGDSDEDGPIERLRRTGFELTQWRDFTGAWTREPFDRAGAVVRLVDLVHVLADVSGTPSYAGDNLFVDTEPVRRLSREWRARVRGSVREPLDPEVLDGLESQLIELRRDRDFKRARKGSGPTYGKGVTRAQVLEARDALVHALDEFHLQADADLAALLHDELRSCLDRYDGLKAREGALDFLDLLLRARDLVRDDAVVRRHFQERFKRIFVDEFQYTDPLQAELLLLLASHDPAETRWEHVQPAPGKLFIVGDPKQSIYRFRRADVDIYRRVCTRLVAAGATPVELHKSFRSVPNIQRVVNAAFEPVMDGDPQLLQARYVGLEPSRDTYPGQPSVVVLPVPEPYGQRFISAREIERSLPDAVGAFVDWLVNTSGWTVTERRNPSERIPIEARHVCILFRRFVSYGEDITRKYVEALEARGLRHLLVGGKAFHDRDEIETIRAALTAIEWPDDQLSVFATLRGALFAIGDEDLLEYHHLCGRFHPFRIYEPLPAHLAPIGSALTLLASLHRQRNRRPVADTISALLDRTRAHVGFVLRPGGEQALANVLHVAELARQYELDGGMSFRGFVEALQEATLGTQAAEAPILEEGSDGVRLMTVHKAKGLEFPVVILADITARLTPYEAARHIDNDRRMCALRIGGWSPLDLVRQQALELGREQKEGERVAYVAATRARDLLVVPAVGDAPYAGGWVGPLNAAIYPPEGSRRIQHAAQGCPVFKSKDSVLRRPDNDPANKFTVCPGEHTFGPPDSGYSVVWWSPEPDALPLGAEAPFGLQRDDLIVKDVPPAVMGQYLDAYEAWRRSRDAALEAGGRPSLHVRTATEWVLQGGRPAAAARSELWRAKEGRPLQTVGTEVEVVELGARSDRPSGARYGSLVHAALATCPLDADSAAIARIVQTQGRILGASESEVSSAADVVRTVLVHPIVADARSADRERRCFREVPVTITIDGVLVEGVVDFALMPVGATHASPLPCTVIDFKTDRAEGELLERYRRQVGLYADAIARATGRPVRAVLMQI